MSWLISVRAIKNVSGLEVEASRSLRFAAIGVGCESASSCLADAVVSPRRRLGRFRDGFLQPVFLCFKI
jgi:hypothetical protein